MLVLSRKINESVIIGENIEVEILEIRGKIVRLGIKAPREVAVVRSELREKLVTDRQRRIDAGLALSASRSSVIMTLSAKR